MSDALKPRVFCSYGISPTIDLASAKAHGDLVFMFTRSSKLNTKDIEGFRRHVAYRLSLYRFTPQVDILLLTGNLYGLINLVVEAMARYEKVKVLCWDSLAGEYVLRHLDRYPVLVPADFTDSVSLESHQPRNDTNSGTS